MAITVLSTHGVRDCLCGTMIISSNACSYYLCLNHVLSHVSPTTSLVSFVQNLAVVFGGQWREGMQ